MRVSVGQHTATPSLSYQWETDSRCFCVVLNQTTAHVSASPAVINQKPINQVVQKIDTGSVHIFHRILTMEAEQHNQQTGP